MKIQTVQAITKQVRMAPRKVTQVASLIKGRTVEDALVILEHTPRRAALAVSKTVNSAAANAEHNHKLDPKTLTISSIEIGQGFAMKRYRPAAHGRALPYKKMTSNIKVVLSGTEKVKKPKAAKKVTKTDSKAKATVKTNDKTKVTGNEDK